MNLTLRRNLRPSNDQMLAYAESLVDGTPMPVKVAGAVASDQQAAQELRAMRSSLELVAAAPELEPSEALTRAILLDARRLREPSQKPGARYVSAWLGLLQGGFFVALTVSAAVLVFGLALRSPAAPLSGSSTPATPVAAKAPAVTPDALNRTAGEVEVLSAALRSGASGPVSPERAQRLRAVNAVDSDLEAALAALERNPGCARATHIVYTSLQRQADSLREFYVDRSL
ncbi:MAG: hypothetical protein RLZZ303_3141 [Candidatus Hydrogenedentota bacterium]|jgi:hypothetical protein